eukprot:1208755-Pleurochrysis_carterae.AAC.1
MPRKHSENANWMPSRSCEAVRSLHRSAVLSIHESAVLSMRETAVLSKAHARSCSSSASSTAFLSEKHTYPKPCSQQHHEKPLATLQNTIRGGGRIGEAAHFEHFVAKLILGSRPNQSGNGAKRQGKLVWAITLSPYIRRPTDNLADWRLRVSALRSRLNEQSTLLSGDSESRTCVGSAGSHEHALAVHRSQNEATLANPRL